MGHQTSVCTALYWKYWGSHMHCMLPVVWPLHNEYNDKNASLTSLLSQQYDTIGGAIPQSCKFLHYLSNGVTHFNCVGRWNKQNARTVYCTDTHSFRFSQDSLSLKVSIPHLCCEGSYRSDTVGEELSHELNKFWVGVYQCCHHALPWINTSNYCATSQLLCKNFI